MITPYLPEEEYKKVEGQLRLNMNGVFDFLKVDNRIPVRYVYGLGVFVEGATNEAVKL